MNPEKYLEMLGSSVAGVDNMNDKDYNTVYHCLKSLGNDKESKKIVEKRFDELRKGLFNPAHPSSRKENAKIRLREKLAQKKLTTYIKDSPDN